MIVPAWLRALPVPLLLIAGCSAVIDTRGNMPSSEDVAKLTPGVTTRAQVAELLGSPTNVATFDDKTWYYVSRKTETTAFFKPQLIDQQVLELKFDDDGVMRDMKHLGLQDGKPVALVDRVTPTAGHSLGFFEQLFGNIGRFSGALGTSPTPGRIPGS